MSHLNFTTSNTLDGNASQPIDAMTLAAWMDGNASLAEQSRVEAWLAENPEAMNDMLILHQTSTASMPATVSSETISQLQINVMHAIEVDDAPAPIKLADHPLTQIMNHWKQWSATAAAVVVLGLAGFWMGGAFAGSGTSVSNSAEPQTVALSEMLNEYNDLNLADPLLPNMNTADQPGLNEDQTQSMLDLLDQMEPQHVSYEDYEPLLMLLSIDPQEIDDPTSTVMALNRMLNMEGDA